MKEINLTIPGFSIAGNTWGDPSKPPILALHGWLDNANSFALLAPYLEKDFYLIAVDLPGHGHSSHLPTGYNYYFFDAIFIIIELIRALNFDKVHLLGHSMGACLGSLVAGVSPEHISSLYLIEGLGPFSAPADTACSQLSTYSQLLIHQRKKVPRGYEQFNNAVLARAQKGYVSLDIAKILCARSIIEKKQKFYWRHDLRLLAPSPLQMTEEQILSCLKDIRCKTELIVATQGFSFEKEIIEERIKRVKKITVQELKGGHHIHMEQPAVVGQLLADFYQKTL